MRSLTLDTTSFTSTLLNLLRLLPNATSNSVWERIPNSLYIKPSPNSSYEARHSYITAKYVDKLFVEPLAPSTSANDLLLRSITDGNLKGVLWALANKANPNARNATLPALLLALLQDEGSLGKSDSGSSTGSIQTSPQFPFAELLVLNGATPIDPSMLPPEASSLGDAARRYLRIKSDRVYHSPQTQRTVPSRSNSAISKSNSGLGISSTSNSSQSAGTTTISADFNKTVGKLQKRLSSGGKNFRAQLSTPLDKERDTDRS
jgi:Arf-GAP/SH3 domain/ANK repeat/PH domain-containing protein